MEQKLKENLKKFALLVKEHGSRSQETYDFWKSIEDEEFKKHSLIIIQVAEKLGELDLFENCDKDKDRLKIRKRTKKVDKILRERKKKNEN